MSAVATALEDTPRPIDAEDPTDFLTPDQRIAVIAEILAIGALRVLKERHEKDIS